MNHVATKVELQEPASQAELEVTRLLAEFAVALRWEDIPAEVIHEAERALIDYYGVALAGSRDEVSEKIFAVYWRRGGKPEASLIGRAERLDILSASLINGAAGHALDFDDTHSDFFYHVTIGIAPALAALGEQMHCSGREFLTAFVAGWEVGARIGRALNPAIYLKGWQSSATIGTFAAAVATAKLLKLDVHDMRNAIGIAASQAGGTRQMLGTMSKPFQVGKAAMNGLLASLLSKEGVTSSLIAIEAPLGFAALTVANPKLDGAVVRLGASYELMRNTFKPYPCCLKHHAIVDAFLELRRKHGVTPASLASAVCKVYPPVLDSANVAEPTTSAQGKFSVQHSAAVAMTDSAAGLAQYTDERVNDPLLATARRKLKFVEDKRMGSGQCELSAERDDGKMFEVRIDSPYGSLAHPLSDADIEAKFRASSASVISAHAQDEMLAVLRTLENMKDISAVASAWSK